ncbi:MAG: hypothetical protein DRO05_04700 [Thermoproteota archaeon]|nr:MAG: hypothetical protein DRO05_04700 [Candidatus Korarchaeota archaeon]
MLSWRKLSMKLHLGLLLLGLLFIGLGGLLYLWQEGLERSPVPGINKTAPAPWSEPPGGLVSENITYIVEATFLIKNERDVSLPDIVKVYAPPNTTHQKVRIVSVEPEPFLVDRDENGNLRMNIKVNLSPNSEIWVNMTLEITVQQYEADLNERAAMWPPLEISQRYTEPTIVWNVENETLRKLAREIVGDEDNPLIMARKLAYWIDENLEYKPNPENLTRGANYCVYRRNGNLIIFGDCTQAADVYITFARSLGIPARAVSGLILMEKEEVQWRNLSMEEDPDRMVEHWRPHIWPQVYLEPWGWIDVDMLVEHSWGVYSWRHIILEVEGEFVLDVEWLKMVESMVFDVEYIEYKVTPLEG